jgi:hypothetical protein
MKELENGSFHQASSESSIVLILMVSPSEMAFNNIITEYFDPTTTTADLGIIPDNLI